MQIVSTGMTNPVSWEKIKKNITDLSSAELAQRVVKVKKTSANILHYSIPLHLHVSGNFFLLCLHEHMGYYGTKDR